MRNGDVNIPKIWKLGFNDSSWANKPFSISYCILVFWISRPSITIEGLTASYEYSFQILIKYYVQVPLLTFIYRFHISSLSISLAFMVCYPGHFTMRLFLCFHFVFHLPFADLLMHCFALDLSALPSCLPATHWLVVRYCAVLDSMTPT